MANEITINATLAYDDEVTVDSLQVTDKLVTVATKIIVRHIQTILTSETVIKLGPVTTIGWMMFKNIDPTNYIEIKAGASGTIIGAMLPGETYGPVRCGQGITAPVAIANSGSCRMDCLITSS